MTRLILTLLLSSSIMLTGCGPLITHTLCANNVLDCSNGRNTKLPDPLTAPEPPK